MQNDGMICSISSRLANGYVFPLSIGGKVIFYTSVIPQKSTNAREQFYFVLHSDPGYFFDVQGLSIDVSPLRSVFIF